MPISDGIEYAPQFQLDMLVLVSSSGARIDLREVMRELNVFEDLFSNTMSGSLFISDTQNLINVLPIIGAEYLVVKLTKPSSPWKIEKTFRVYKITDRRKGTPNSEDYLLHFCSEELIIDHSIKVSNSYKQMTVSEIIKDIAFNYLKINTDKLPSTELTQTVGNFDLLIPFWTPFRAINWLSRLARTANEVGCSFLFYEDGEGFHFNSIESLSQQTPTQIVNFMPLGLAGQSKEKSDKTDMQQRLESAEEYQFENTPDTLKLFSDGLYSSKLMLVNVLDQEIHTHRQNGRDFFNNTKHLNKNTFLQNSKDRTLTEPTDHHDSYFRISVDNLKVETWMLQRNAYFAAIHGFQIKVVVPGNMSLRVGGVVTLNFPAASIGRREEKPMDVLYSGNYLITAIRHKIDRVKYACVLELSKDSLLSPLPEPLEGNPGMDKLRTL